MTEPLRTHPFHHSGQWDWRGRALCECGSIKGASIHQVPERTDEERAEEARRMGEMK